MQWSSFIQVTTLIGLIGLLLKLNSERSEIRPTGLRYTDRGYWELSIKNGGPGNAYNVRVLMGFRDKKVLSELEISTLNPKLFLPVLKKQAVGENEIFANDEQKYHVPEEGLAFQIAQETPIIIQWKSKFGLPYKKLFYYSQSSYGENTFSEITGIKKYI